MGRSGRDVAKLPSHCVRIYMPSECKQIPDIEATMLTVVDVFDSE